MPIIETKGSMSSQGYGQFARSGAAPVYIEDVFSTWLYTGNGSTQTITNGIDLATKGGLVWNKFRNSSDFGHVLTDTNRGAFFQLRSDSTVAQTNEANRITSFNATGFSIGNSGFVNQNNGLYVSWTFAKQPKFFDVVTYTGDGTNRTIAHDLGSVPGCVIVKRLNDTGAWWVWHRSLGSDDYIQLNSTNAVVSGFTNVWGPMTSTTFGVDNNAAACNINGATYVAYLFAHDAGGFGASGTDNVISCGSYTGNSAAAGPIVNLGWEPQWILLKAANSSGNWVIVDNMRGLVASTNQNNAGTAYLYAESNNSESISTTSVGIASITPTGFQLNGGTVINYAGESHIYIAIRRGPMRTPTSGTSVFSPLTQTGANATAGQTLTTGFPVDLEISEGRSSNSGAYLIDRLRGGQAYLTSYNTAAELIFTSWTPLIGFANNTGITDANYGSTSQSYVAWNFRRAPGFFDVVCYTGGASSLVVNHNLGVAPELIISKNRTGTNETSWYVGSASLPNGFTGAGHVLELQSTAASSQQGYFTSVNSTSATYANVVARSGQTYVTYLFASCPGVSKVGTYTGTGSTVQVDCGFTAGARFVLIKRINGTGDWYVWDSARGIVAGNDPYLLLNSTAAEVTSTDWVDTLATGFEVSNAGSNLVNVNGGTYLFLAVS